MLGVIVLNWNGGQDLLDCLRSVYAQEDCGTEIVVYVPDNASTDGSLEAVRRDFPQARTIQNGGNLGFSGGNNPGWRQAVADGAEWIFFLNNDAALAPDCLRRMLDVMRANPNIGAACPKIYFGTPATHPEGKPTPDAEPQIWFEKGVCNFAAHRGVSHVDATPAERSSLWYESAWCNGCCFLTTGRLLEQVGGFDEGFFAYCEDVDLSLKIRGKGLGCATIPSAVAWHKVSQSTINEPTPAFVFYIARNMYRLGQRHAPRPKAWAAFRLIHLRQTVGLTSHYARIGNTLMGATLLQGYLHGQCGYGGIRPAQKPGLALMAAAKLIQGIYKVRNQFLSKPAESTVSLAGNSRV